MLALPFIAAGAGIGAAEIAEHAAVAASAPENMRGSAFGLLAAIQALGNVAANAIAGILWTAVSPGSCLRLPHRLDGAGPRRVAHRRPSLNVSASRLLDCEVLATWLLLNPPSR